MTDAPANVLTFDLEDWYQLSERMLTGRSNARTEILDRQVDRLLELLGRHQTRATFFCLGCSLAPAPQIVRKIARAGHEIASHGWDHRLIYQTGLAAFREDLQRSLSWLEDLLGRAVAGYRAPAFSIPPTELEGFYDICLEAGLRYDSSVFPIRGRRYGIPSGPVVPTVVRQTAERKLVELPLATLSLAGRRWPVAGGGYWRILPAWAIRRTIRALNRNGQGFVTYLHPYEFDSCRLSAISAAGVSARAIQHELKQNLGRKSIYDKLDSLLSGFRFVSAEDFLNEPGNIQPCRPRPQVL